MIIFVKFSFELSKQREILRYLFILDNLEGRIIKENLREMKLEYKEMTYIS